MAGQSMPTASTCFLPECRGHGETQRGRQSTRERKAANIPAVHIAGAGVSCPGKAPEQPRPVQRCPESASALLLTGCPAARQTRLSDAPLVLAKGPVPRPGHLGWGRKAPACLLTQPTPLSPENREEKSRPVNNKETLIIPE